MDRCNPRARNPQTHTRWWWRKRALDGCWLTFFDLFSREVRAAFGGTGHHIREADAEAQEFVVIVGCQGLGRQAAQVQTLPWKKKDRQNVRRGYCGVTHVHSCLTGAAAAAGDLARAVGKSVGRWWGIFAISLVDVFFSFSRHNEDWCRGLIRRCTSWIGWRWCSVMCCKKLCWNLRTLF